jgi:hypothetical protein
VSAVEDPEQLLVDLLTRTVADCRAWMRHDVVPVDEGQWQAICDLTKR